MSSAPDTMGSELEITVEVSDTHSGVVVATIAVLGELDAHSTGALDAAFDEALRAHPTLVQLDATATSFLDSTGLRAIVRNAERVAEHRARFHLSGASASVRRVLEITDLLERYRLR